MYKIYTVKPEKTATEASNYLNLNSISELEKGAPKETTDNL